MEAPHHKYCKCPDCELFAQMQAHFGTNKPEPNTRPGEALKPPFHFDRYVGGVLMAEGVTIERRGDLASAILAAARIAPKGANGQVPVLVLRPEPNTRPLPQPSELVDDDARLILRLAGVRNKLTPGAIERADLDGMAFTIGESQDRIAEMSAQIAKLQADGDKLAGALDRSRQGWSNVLELGLLPVQHQSTALGLQEAATQALAAKGDSRG